MKELLIDLLCIAHRDGGHYIEKVGLEQATEDAKHVYYKLRQDNEDMRAAMQRFVDKVDRGEARSTKTYNEFKELLAR